MVIKPEEQSFFILAFPVSIIFFIGILFFFFCFIGTTLTTSLVFILTDTRSPQPRRRCWARRLSRPRVARPRAPRPSRPPRVVRTRVRRAPRSPWSPWRRSCWRRRRWRNLSYPNHSNRCTSPVPTASTSASNSRVHWVSCVFQFILT